MILFFAWLILRTFTGQGAVRAVAFSPADKQILSGGEDRVLKLWEVKTGKELLTLAGHTQPIWTVAFSPDGKHVASESTDNTLRVWDTVTGKELHSFAGERSIIAQVAFTPDGKRVLEVSTYKDAIGKVWDVASGKELARFKGQGGSSSRRVALSSKGRLALASVPDRSNPNADTIRLFEVESGRELRAFTGLTTHVRGLAFSSDDRLVIAVLSNGLKVFEAESGRELSNVVVGSRVFGSAAFSTDRRLILVPGGKDLKVWDLNRPADYPRFEARLEQARERLHKDPQNPEALATFGEWYAFRGVWDWAIELLEQARRKGAKVSPLTLGRCYWQRNDPARNDLEAAHRELELSLRLRETDDAYLRLCVQALSQAKEKSGR